MTPQTTADRYFAEARTWANDRQQELRRSRLVAWIVAGAAVTVALAEALALLFLMPLKTVVPYTLLVDRHTGYVQALKPLEAGLLAPDAALTRSFVVQYVIAREGFDINALQTDYRKVALWSAGRARTEYLSQIQAGNPESPLARYPRSTVVDVVIKSISAIGANLVLVRFDTQRKDAGNRSVPARSWAAVVRYAYSSDPMPTEDRTINPLGFKVLHYRRTIETLAPSGAESAVTVDAPDDQSRLMRAPPLFGTMSPAAAATSSRDPRR